MTLDYAVKIGLVLLAGAALLYFAGILGSDPPPASIRDYWHLDPQEYQEVTHGSYSEGKTWDWLLRLSSGEYFAYLPVAFLGVITVFSLVRIAPILLKKRDIIMFSIVCAQVAFLLLSISGVLTKIR